MSVNLVSLASQSMTPSLIDKIGSAVGLNASLAGKACSAALPALFAGFADLASRPEGARKLADAVGQERPSVVEALAPTVDGMSKQQPLVDGGLRSLGSLLGNSSLSALSGAIAKFAGVSQSASSSLLGILTPMVMGFLGKQAAERGLDASGLASLLTSQKSNVMAAMPSGFGEMLRSAGFPMDPERIPDAARAAEPSIVLGTPYPAQSSSWSAGNVTWVLPAFLVAALGWLIWSGRIDPISPTDTVPGATNAAVTSAMTPARNISAAGVDLTSTVQTALSGVKSTLEGIKDEASARSALPGFEAASAAFDKVVQLSGQLPAESRTALAGLVKSARPGLEQLFDKAMAIPGAESVTKPAIDSLRAKLETLGSA